MKCLYQNKVVRKFLKKNRCFFHVIPAFCMIFKNLLSL